MRVFLDKTSLSANPALWPTIERALGQSEFFSSLGITHIRKFTVGAARGSLVVGKQNRQESCHLFDRRSDSLGRQGGRL